MITTIKLISIVLFYIILIRLGKVRNNISNIMKTECTKQLKQNK
jgi:hypothetical protein